MSHALELFFTRTSFLTTLTPFIFTFWYLYRSQETSTAPCLSNSSGKQKSIFFNTTRRTFKIQTRNCMLVCIGRSGTQCCINKFILRAINRKRTIFLSNNWFSFEIACMTLTDFHLNMMPTTTLLFCKFIFVSSRTNKIRLTFFKSTLTYLYFRIFSYPNPFEFFFLVYSTGRMNKVPRRTRLISFLLFVGLLLLSFNQKSCRSAFLLYRLSHHAKFFLMYIKKEDFPKWRTFIALKDSPFSIVFRSTPNLLAKLLTAPFDKLC